VEKLQNLDIFICMDKGFKLPVNYNGKDLLFPAKLVRFGYSYRIEVEMNGEIISFEKDEERNWSALAENHDMGKSNSIDQQLLPAIADSLDDVLE
jgi:hypothetical protein